MRIPQPIKIWFNHSQTTLKQSTAGSSEPDNANFIAYNRNPLLLIGLNNLILEVTTTFPPPEEADQVMETICTQLRSFYESNLQEIRAITLEFVPSLVFVYLHLYTHFEYTTVSGNVEHTENELKNITSHLECDENREKPKSQPRYSILLQKAKSMQKNQMRNHVKLPNLQQKRSNKPRSGIENRVTCILLSLEDLFLMMHNSHLSKCSSEQKINFSELERDFLGLTVFCDSLSLSQAVPTSHRRKSRENDEQIDINQQKIRLNLPDENPTPNAITAVNSSNRMEILTGLLMQADNNLTSYALYTHESLCRLAMLINPLNRLPTSSLADVQRRGFADQEEFIEMITSTSSDFQQMTMNKIDPSSNVDKFSNKLPAPENQATYEGDSKLSKNSHICYPLLNGVSEIFAKQIVHCLFRSRRDPFEPKTLEALCSVESRAIHELWTEVLLLINAMRNIYETWKSSWNRDMKKGDTNAQPNTIQLNPQELSLAGAYCGLWSELVEQREDKPVQLPVAANDPMHSQIVRLAQAKFMRVIVTNVSFHSEKPPDDIIVRIEPTRRSLPGISRRT